MTNADALGVGLPERRGRRPSRTCGEVTAEHRERLTPLREAYIESGLSHRKLKGLAPPPGPVGEPRSRGAVMRHAHRTVRNTDTSGVVLPQTITEASMHPPPQEECPVHTQRRGSS
ncbi:hypothetical protein SUDANB126_06858 [Streptomyces sp. enrichment culture]